MFQRRISLPKKTASLLALATGLFPLASSAHGDRDDDRDFADHDGEGVQVA